MRVKSEEAIRIHSGWVRVTPRLSFGGDSPGASHRRHLLPQTACLAVKCARHGIAPNPPCRGVPMRRVEGSPGEWRRLGILRGGWLKVGHEVWRIVQYECYNVQLMLPVHPLQTHY